MSGPLRCSRIEYVSWAVNWRRGCSHGCLYCYAAAMARRFGYTPGQGWEQSLISIPNPSEALRAQLRRRRKMPAGVILVSSSHDPFMPGSVDLARGWAEGWEIMKALAEFDLLPQVLLLTKAPRVALHTRPSGLTGFWFGTSLTALEPGQAAQYEPLAESPLERLNALREASAQGLQVWISIEPPLPGFRLINLVEIVLHLKLNPAPWLVLGKMNARSSPCEELRQWTFSPHWAEDRDTAVCRLQQAGFRESLQPVAGGYWIKHELGSE